MKRKRSEPWLKAVGARLDATGRALGAKQVELAAVAGVSPQAWNNYLQGMRPLDIGAAINLCDRYRLTLDWLYRGIPGGLPFELERLLAPAKAPPKIIPMKRGKHS